MDRKDSPTLSDRRQVILKTIVEEYTATARPVGSETIVAKYHLGVSSATIRNEMAALESMGYIHHTYTSAGRIPSDQGYRYYVEHLMDETPLPSDEQRMIGHQFHQVQLTLTEWLRLSVAVMAQSVQSAALVTEPRAAQTKLKHVELISIQETLALLVAVFHGGSLQQQMFALPVILSQDELRAISMRLTHTLAGLTAPQIEAYLHTYGLMTSPGEEEAATSTRLAIDALVIDYLLKMMRTMDEQVNGPIHYDGLTTMLSLPEFSSAVTTRPQRQHVERIVEIIELLQQGMFFKSVLHGVAHSDGVQVIIGGEGQREEMSQYSIILSRYGVSGEVSGVLGVLGPTRMHYARAIAVVRFMTGILTNLAGDLYG